MTGFTDAARCVQNSLVILFCIDMVISLQSLAISIQYYRRAILITLNGIVFALNVVALNYMQIVCTSKTAPVYGKYYEEFAYYIGSLDIRTGILAAFGIGIPVFAFICIVISISAKSPSYLSIKETADNLPMAVCYFDADGSVRLCNLKMYEVYRKLTGKYLRSLNELRDAVNSYGKGFPLWQDNGEKNTLIFFGENILQYEERIISVTKRVKYTESIFTDITGFYNTGLRINEQTEKLKKRSEELKELSDNAIELIRENEILRAKTRLHDQMGTALVAVRKLLSEEQSEKKDFGATGLLKQAVENIQNDNNYYMGRERLDDFLWNARAVGVEPEINGEFPGNEEITNVFFIAMQECLTNAVKHGNADRMKILMISDEGEESIVISNNGATDYGEMMPKGGLVNLEKHVRKVNGTIEIQREQEFQVRIRIPENTVETENRLRFPREETENQSLSPIENGEDS